MNVKDTKIAKHLNIGLYNFLWTVGAFLFISGGAWVATKYDIKINATYGQETRTIATQHISNNKVHLTTKTALTNNNLDNQVKINTNTLNKIEPLSGEHETKIAVLEANYKTIETGIGDINRKLNILINKQ